MPYTLKYDRSFFMSLGIDQLSAKFAGTEGSCPLTKQSLSKALAFFQDQGLIVAPYNREERPCPVCKAQMYPKKKYDRSKLGWHFVCGANDNHTLNPLKHSFFVNERATHLDFYKALALICWELWDFGTVRAIQHLKVSSRTAVDWLGYVKEVMAMKMRETMGPIGGKGLHVQMDETFIFNRKYNRGRQVGLQAKDGKLKLVGGICEETKECFLLLVDDCKKDSIWPVIKQFVLPGSIIYTDGAQIYRDLCGEAGKAFGFDYQEHDWVNHSIGQYTKRSKTEVNQVVTTNQIEVLWRWIKDTVTGHGAADRVELEIYEYMYRHRFLRYEQSEEGVPGQQLNTILEHMREFFPGNPFLAEAPLRSQTPRFYDELNAQQL